MSTLIQTLRFNPFSGFVTSRFGALPYLLSVFLGAVLIFLVQPMFAKMATPLLGGSPSVWNVSLVCFQAALLLGYGYAHLLARIRSVQVQVAIHGGLFLLGMICLPLGITGALGEPNADQPTLWLIGVFALSVALPFAVVSATAPLVQSWYARTGRDDAADPYHLYAASNVGSLLGLAAYPLLLEPLTAVATQSASWAVGYGILMILLMVSGLLAAAGHQNEVTTESTADTRAALSWRERLVWLALAFIPSSLLVGATTHITTDIAAAPFLWVPPLTVYLLTFVFVFSKQSPIPLDFSQRVMPLAVAAVAMMLPVVVRVSMPIEIGVTLFALFMVAIVCHGTLADRRPHVSRLTEFYLIMSLGGVLGGAFNALLAPVIFNGIYEYPLMLAIALLVVPTANNSFDRHGRFLLAGLAIVVILSVLGMQDGVDSRIAIIATVLAAMVLALGRTRRWVMVSAFSVICFISAQSDLFSGHTEERGFFGIVRVSEPGNGLRIMAHGTTIHGVQYIDGEKQLRPLSYYAPETPLGQSFDLMADAKTVGVVGLGVGSMACYAKPGQEWVFYEIDPIVVDMAKDPQLFTYMSECAPDAEILVGDARVKLAHSEPGRFDLLLLDAFSSNAIPVHLVTREAMQMYLDRLSKNGVFVAHISNRHVSLDKVFARLAGAEGAIAMTQFYVPPEQMKSDLEVFPTHAIAIAKSEAALEAFAASGKWETIESDGGRPWTDDYSNIIGAMLDKARR